MAVSDFFNATSAGTMTINNINGAQLDFGSLGGTDTATAGSATIINDASTIGFLANTAPAMRTSPTDRRRQLSSALFGRYRYSTAGNATILQ